MSDKQLTPADVEATKDWPSRPAEEWAKTEDAAKRFLDKHADLFKKKKEKEP